MRDTERTKVRDTIAGVLVKYQPKPIPINFGEAQQMAEALLQELETDSDFRNNLCDHLEDF